MNRRNTALVGLATLALSAVTIVAIARPKTTIDPAEDPWGNTPGLYEPATECLAFEIEHRDGGVERICLSDEELGTMVRQMGAVCMQDKTQVALALGEVRERRRLKKH